MEMLPAIKYIFNILLTALGAIGIGMSVIFHPMWADGIMNTFLITCAIAVVYGLNNSEYDFSEE